MSKGLNPHTAGSSSNATAAHALVASLQRHGVKVLFGQSLPSQVHLAAPQFGLRQVAYRTENAGAAMADGYARVSNRVAVVTAQNGPAATLLVPGLAEAYKSSIPVVAIVQDVKRFDADRNAFQEFDHFGLFGACAKWVRRVERPERMHDYVDMAFTAAATGRPGPAVLLCPFDVLDEPAEVDGGRGLSLGAYPIDRSIADPSKTAAAADMIRTAHLPIIVAGGGVHLSLAYDELHALMDEVGIPVATTQMGKGAVDESHPLALGVGGYIMGKRGMAKFHRPLIEEADVVLLVGTRTNQNGTDSWSMFSPRSRFIHIDVDGREIGRNYEATRLLGDAKLTLDALGGALKVGDLAMRRDRRPDIEERIADGRRRHRDECRSVVESADRPIRPERLMGDLDTLLTPESIVVADASFASVWVCNYLTARKGGMRFVTPRGLAGLGWGLPMALGAKVARPASPVFCLVGDGGFGHCWAELETARRMGLNVVLVVLNNHILAYQKHFEDRQFGGHTDACDFMPVDHAAIAAACGWRGIRIENPDDFLPAVREAMAGDLPTLIDVETDPAAMPPVTVFGS